MVALLRFMYDLPFDELFKDRSILLPYAKVYIVADKYQVYGLKSAASDKMQCHITKGMGSIYHLYKPDIDDFLVAIETIATNTTPDDKLARKVMVEACAICLRDLHQIPEFLSILRGSADLGAAIIGHEDLDASLGGSWISEANSCLHSISLSCNICEYEFEAKFIRRNRRSDRWTCPQCSNDHVPTCFNCSAVVTWEESDLC